MDQMENMRENQKPAGIATWQQRLFQNLKDIVYVFAGFMLVYCMFFRMVVVDGTSMNQTFLNGDRLLLVSNALYRNPEAGDIVVFSRDSFRNGEGVVKRVIATEGQTVDIDFAKRTVYVDGKALQESYVYFRPEDARPMMQEGMTFPLTVEEGCVFVMGDNRNNSKDSRDPEIGLVDRREILGKAVFLLMPGTNNGETKLEYDRIGLIR